MDDTEYAEPDFFAEDNEPDPDLEQQQVMFLTSLYFGLQEYLHVQFCDDAVMNKLDIDHLCHFLEQGQDYRRYPSPPRQFREKWSDVYSVAYELFFRDHVNFNIPSLDTFEVFEKFVFAQSECVARMR